MIAVDSHLHILDPRFEGRNGARVPAEMAVSDYKKARAVYGTNRAVVVQSKSYGTDPACLLDALAQFGADGRGIAAPDPSLSDETLADLDAAGVRGVRFSLWNPTDAVATFDMLAPFGERLKELGWHAQLHMHADHIAEAAETLRALPCPMVFDHMGEHPKAWGNCVLLLMLAGIVDAFCTRNFPAKDPPSGHQPNDLASRVGFFVDHLT